MSVITERSAVTSRVTISVTRSSFWRASSVSGPSGSDRRMAGSA